MKVEDVLIVEYRSVINGRKVIPRCTDPFIKKVKNDINSRRKKSVIDAVNDITKWYNHTGTIEGKLKKNHSSETCYHYHIGFPSYDVLSNSRYSTSDWMVFYELEYDEDENVYFIYFYDYDHHRRTKDWNRTD